MVRCSGCMDTRRLSYDQVISSIIAAWSDITHTFHTYSSSRSIDGTFTPSNVHSPAAVVGQLNAGYVWMLVNCLVTAAYVRDSYHVL